LIKSLILGLLAKDQEVEYWV